LKKICLVSRIPTQNTEAFGQYSTDFWQIFHNFLIRAWADTVPFLPSLLPGIRSLVLLFWYEYKQWRTQKIFMGGVHSMAYGGHLYLAYAVCDVTVWRHIHVSKPTFSRNLL